MAKIEGQGISFSYENSQKIILDNITFSISRDSRIGIVGNNGCGKTTLLKIINGELTGFKGNFIKDEALKVVLLAQEIEEYYEHSIEEFLWGRESRTLLRAKNKVEAGLSLSANEIEDYYAFLEAGGYEKEALFNKLIQNFFGQTHLKDKSITKLSGGERTKISIVKILEKRPDLILFDEPTNNLDLESILWLEEYLKELKIPFVISSHDEKLLSKVTNEIWEIDRGRLNYYSGNYENFLDEKEIIFQNNLQQFEKGKKKILELESAINKKRDMAQKMEKFKQTRSIKKNGALCKKDEGSGSASANPQKPMRAAKAMEKRCELIRESFPNQRPTKESGIKISFNDSRVGKSGVIFSFNNFNYGYDQLLFENCNLSFQSKKKYRIKGPNGCGKSTLLKILAGRMHIEDSSFYEYSNLKKAYYSQDFSHIDLMKTGKEILLNQDKEHCTKAMVFIHKFGIKRERLAYPIKELSLGERVKISLIKVLIGDVDVLILDEPTNHLEIRAKNALKEALCSFKGTVIYVSHDRMFVLDKEEVVEAHNFGHNLSN